VSLSPGPVGGGLRSSIDRLVDQHESDWKPLLEDWRRSAEGRRLIEFLDHRLEAGAAIYPAEVFRALSETPLSRVRVLILGQDPYHGPGQAEGLAFSVPAGARLPPSLRNIVAELQRDLGLPTPRSGSLLPWARQGVMLLNTTLTVEQGRPASHANAGWQALTDKIVLSLSRHSRAKVFMLWGAHAQSKARLLEGGGARQLLLQCNHPSPLSARRGPVPFLGCAHFSRAHDFLAGADPGAPRLDWRLDVPADAFADRPVRCER